MKQADDELCARWIAVGAWYPYARDHHADGWQELFRSVPLEQSGSSCMGLLPHTTVPLLQTACCQGGA